MESLSPQCTPLKRDYDNCFNAWFEGYLQPALKTSHRIRPSDDVPRVQDTTPAPLTPADPNIPSPDARPSSSRKATPLSWSSAFPSSKHQPLPRESRQPTRTTPIDSTEPVILPPIDTTGKTRAQVKALEYEQACGEKWRRYRACLQAAIDENQSLSSMLQQARVDHPLQSTEGLQGTVWGDEKAS